MTHAVDILITSYYQPEFLDECLESVAEQTWRDFQVHVVDDSPGNPVLPVIEKWRARGLPIEFTQNETNVGPLRSLQKMYSASHAEFFMWLNHDDLLKPDFLQKVVQQGLMQEPSCGFAYSLYERYENGQASADTGVYRPDLATGVHDIIHSLCITNWIISSFAVIRRQNFDAAGGLLRHLARNEISGKPDTGYLDLYFFSRMAARSPAYVLNETQGYYRIHANSNTSATAGESKRAEGTLSTFDYIFDDQNTFSRAQRFLTKANCLGRIMTDMGVIQAALTMLKSSELGKELRPIAKELLEATHQGLNPMIFDLASHNRPKLIPQAHLDELRNLINQL